MHLIKIHLCRLYVRGTLHLAKTKEAYEKMLSDTYTIAVFYITNGCAKSAGRSSK